MAIQRGPLVYCLEQADNGESLHNLWLPADAPFTTFEGRAERINITMPKRLLNKIDTYVRNNPDYANRSAFLAEAARRVLPGA
nr:type II toxin-antitoxin system HicB family antitoxin [Escherichia coli]